MSEPLLPMTIVAAIARNGALGKDNAIPWRAPSDLKRFREITWGRPLIMGRKTYQVHRKALAGPRNRRRDARPLLSYRGRPAGASSCRA